MTDDQSSSQIIQQLLHANVETTEISKRICELSRDLERINGGIEAGDLDPALRNKEAEILDEIGKWFELREEKKAKALKLFKCLLKRSSD